MKLRILTTASLLVLFIASFAGAELGGTLRPWHKLTLSLNGPQCEEQGVPNPFLDYRMTVEFTHSDGTAYTVPGYFAADGRAAESSATGGDVWRAHFAADREGQWTWKVTFVTGEGISVSDAAGEPVEGIDSLTGKFTVLSMLKREHGFYSDGRLEYVRERYLQFAHSKRYFFKFGPDAPETLLAYRDFDGTIATKDAGPLKDWSKHVQDWNESDPTWKDGKGKGLIGALNYLHEQGCNAYSFIPYNTGGDGDNVWPHTSRDERLRFDCSKLDQWGIVFDHGQELGLMAHFKLQETENDDERHAHTREPKPTPAAMDRGELGVERKLYLRELIARFGYLLALEWNLGEENTQAPEVQKAMFDYVNALDPYNHLIVIHTYPQDHERICNPLLGHPTMSGLSLQFHWKWIHPRTLKWINASREAKQPWVVCNDEQNSHETGVPNDPGYEGHDGVARPSKGDPYDLNDIRKSVLWGNLTAGGGGVMYYFGYKLPQNDLNCDDFRSRHQSWSFGKIALDFLQRARLPDPDVLCRDDFVSNGYCLAEPGKRYFVFTENAAELNMNLGDDRELYSVRWFDPRNGGKFQRGSVDVIDASAEASIGIPPQPKSNSREKSATEDWVAVIEKANGQVFEAEDFDSQSKTNVREWQRISTSEDGSHEGAHSGAYLKLLPDTRKTHADQLIVGENFSNEPGKLAILNYKVDIPEPGRYYIWVRAFSAGSEDNGIHVGLNGEWPATGQRMQWCAGKNSWRWESRQRTAEEHCGVPGKIYLDIEKSGEHTISFSMREDGFEFDCWMLTSELVPLID